MDYTCFQENLKRPMPSRDFSMKAFGDEVGMTAATLSCYLSGNRTPDDRSVVQAVLRKYIEEE